MRYLIDWLREYIDVYNVFIPEENEYGDNDNDEPTDSAATTRYQRYATRLYVPLLIVILYILFFITLIYPQSEVVTISNITPSLFVQLHRDHAETLSCACTNTIVPYEAFVSNTIKFDPVCSSIFISNPWIEALYLSYASALLVMDFRTTASSQFKLLAAFCSMCEDTIYQALIDLDNNQLITLQLVPEDELRSRIIATIEFTQSTIPTQILSLVTFVQITTRSNSLTSALNTNAIILLENQLHDLQVRPTYYFDKNAPNYVALQGSPCHLKSSKTPAGFYPLEYAESARMHDIWPADPPYFEPIAAAMVDGFFGACDPLDAILASTLDCLHNNTCLELFIDYFPSLNHINLNWTSSFVRYLCKTSILVLLMFTSLNAHTIIINEYSPSLKKFTELHNISSEGLKCPCQNVTIQYQAFTSLTPIFHQVCSSDFVSESWINMASVLDSIENGGREFFWFGLGARHLQLLSTICQLANDTIDDAIRRFNTQSFITSNVLIQSDFDVQLNTTLVQFKQSLIIYFNLLIKTIHLFTRSDQPYTRLHNAELNMNTMTNETDQQQLMQFNFNLTGWQNSNSTTPECICATDYNCRTALSPSIVRKE
ncbi:hypothetical protein I4U23_023371 [Adineta vaga]|nr:hypothetical protein I4U23_023371 [Adineta vaga]